MEEEEAVRMVAKRCCLALRSAVAVKCNNTSMMIWFLIIMFVFEVSDDDYGRVIREHLGTFDLL